MTRYFGGTKLGIGGLARAYGDAANAALDAAALRRGIPAVRLEVRYPFTLTAAVMRCVERSSAREIEHGYEAASGMAVLRLVLPHSGRDALRAGLREQTSGEVEPNDVGDTTLYLPA